MEMMRIMMAVLVIMGLAGLPVYPQSIIKNMRVGYAPRN
jgi:hypothetical protein